MKQYTLFGWLTVKPGDQIPIASECEDEVLFRFQEPTTEPTTPDSEEEAERLKTLCILIAQSIDLVNKIYDPAKCDTIHSKEAKK